MCACMIFLFQFSASSEIMGATTVFLDPPDDLFSFVQARLNEIITSGAKNVHNTGSSDVPWMTDGAGLPSNASELLPKLVIAF